MNNFETLQQCRNIDEIIEMLVESGLFGDILLEDFIDWLEDEV